MIAHKGRILKKTFEEGSIPGRSRGRLRLLDPPRRGYPYSLEFYSVSWKALREQLAQPPPEVIEQVSRQEWPLVMPSRDAAADAFPRAVQEISQILKTASDAAPPLSDTTALALVAMVRHLGVLLGSLEHSSAAGEDFAENFFGEAAASAFCTPDLLERLTDRPFYGLAADVFPTWGGLREDELAALVSAYRPPEKDLEEDFAAWLEEFRDLLKMAAAARIDLITLYL